MQVRYERVTASTKTAVCWHVAPWTVAGRHFRPAYCLLPASILKIHRNVAKLKYLTLIMQAVSSFETSESIYHITQKTALFMSTCSLPHLDTKLLFEETFTDVNTKFHFSSHQISVLMDILSRYVLMYANESKQFLIKINLLKITNIIVYI